MKFHWASDNDSQFSPYIVFLAEAFGLEWAANVNDVDDDDEIDGWNKSHKRKYTDTECE